MNYINIQKNKHLKRLERIWIKDPIFFITTCTENRRKILDNHASANIIENELVMAKERHGWYVGRYVIMPDHIHFFCSPDEEAKDLRRFMQAWKEWTSKRLARECGIFEHIWQKEFFDHMLRSEDSYQEKWQYVLNNPVRAGFAKKAEEWPWQGEIEVL